VFNVNGRFGNRFVFQRYIDNSELIIPGEVQHSFWLHEKWFQQNKRLSLNYPKYVWGGTFYELAQKRGQNGFIPIGDPFLYHLKTCKCNVKTPSNPNYWGLYPQFSRLDTRLARFEKHRLFIDEILNAVSEPLKVFFHPWEEVTDEISALYRARNIQVEPQLFAGDQEFLTIKHLEYLDLRGLITNYVGPHVFRATIVGVECWLTSTSSLSIRDSILGNEHIEMFDPNYGGNYSFKDREAMSEFQLGKSFVKTPYEIETLFRSDLKSQAKLRRIKRSRDLITKSKNIFLRPEEMTFPINRNFKTQCEHCFSGHLSIQNTLTFQCNSCFRKFNLRPTLSH